jgi:hypothetical protein
LSVPFCNVSDFIPDDIARVVPFAFADEFPFQGTLAARDVGARDEDKDFEVLEALNFVFGASDPELAFGGGEGLRPKWIVVGVRLWDKGPVRK